MGFINTECLSIYTCEIQHSEAPRNLPSLSKMGGFSSQDTKQQESHMKRMRSEAGIFKGDLRIQTLDSHENKWESVGKGWLIFTPTKRLKLATIGKAF